MRRGLLIGVALALVVGVPVVAIAAPGDSGSPVGTQSSIWTATTGTTSSSKFQAIPALSGLDVCASDQVTATLSVELSGAPTGFQIRVDNATPIQPGAVRFVPLVAHQSFSFTWLASVSTLTGSDQHVFDVEWRSTSSRPVTLERGTLNLLYQHGSQDC